MRRNSVSRNRGGRGASRQFRGHDLSHHCTHDLADGTEDERTSEQVLPGCDIVTGEEAITTWLRAWPPCAVER
jgi:hypothetical protein